MKQFSFFVCALTIALQTNAQPSSFAPRGIGGGGALFFPRINPAADSEFYIACDMSQFFHSTNWGGSYTQIPFSKLQSLNVSTYEWTSTPSIAYSNHNDGNNGYPVKTTDGGATWTALPGYNASLGMVYKMSANYSNPQQLLINYYGDIYFSANGGTTFSLVKHAASNGAGLIMGGVFWDGANIYIGTNDGLITSTNGGTSFSVMATTGITAGQVIWSFSGAKAGSTLRFVCITAATTDVYNGVMPWNYNGFAKGVYTMDGASGTWASKSSGISFSTDYVMYTGMAWNDVSTMYLAGSDGSTGGPLVYKSGDGGGTWSKVFKTANNQNILTGWSGQSGDKGWSWGEAAFGIAVAPGNSSRLLFGDYSFVHTSADGGASWKEAYVPMAEAHPAGAATPTKQAYHSIGLENTTCWQVTWQSPTAMMSAFSDIGAIRSADSGKSWSYNYTGMSPNSVYRIAQASNGTLYAATSGIHDMYQSTRLKDANLDAADANGKIMYSTDGGGNWTMLHGFAHPVFWIALDPNNTSRMYASVVHYGGGGSGSQGGIWMTNNLSAQGSSTWTKLTAPPRTEGHPASITVLNDGKVLCSFSGRINPSNAFTASSGVFLYDPGTSTWSDVSDAGMQYWTKDIVLDPADVTQNTWYACVFSGWGGAPNGKGGLYKTTNRGASWTKLTGTQFTSVTSITFNPTNSAQAFLTTEMQGLWFSNNMTATTPLWTLVSAYPFRQPERVFFNPHKPDEVWVSSFGNGMKVGSMGGNVQAVAQNNMSAKGFSLWPNPAHDKLWVMRDGTGQSSVVLSLSNASGQCLRTLRLQRNESGRFDVSGLPGGMYWITGGTTALKWVKE